MITLTRTISVLGNPLSSIARTIISLQQSPQLHATFQFNFQFKSKEHTHKHIFFHHNQRLPRSSRNKCLIIQLEYINVHILPLSVASEDTGRTAGTYEYAISDFFNCRFLFELVLPAIPLAFFHIPFNKSHYSFFWSILFFE